MHLRPSAYRLGARTANQAVAGSRPRTLEPARTPKTLFLSPPPPDYRSPTRNLAPMLAKTNKAVRVVRICMYVREGENTTASHSNLIFQQSNQVSAGREMLQKKAQLL